MAKLGRRVRGYFRRDWFEITMTALGLLFLGLSLFLVYLFIYLAVHFADAAPSLPIGRGMLQTSKGFGLAVFGVGALVTFGVGWTFAGEPIRRTVRGLRRPRRDR